MSLSVGARQLPKSQPQALYLCSNIHGTYTIDFHAASPWPIEMHGKRSYPNLVYFCERKKFVQYKMTLTGYCYL